MTWTMLDFKKVGVTSDTNYVITDFLHVVFENHIISQKAIKNLFG